MSLSSAWRKGSPLVVWRNFISNWISGLVVGTGVASSVWICIVRTSLCGMLVTLMQPLYSEHPMVRPWAWLSPRRKWKAVVWVRLWLYFVWCWVCAFPLLLLDQVDDCVVFQSCLVYRLWYKLWLCNSVEYISKISKFLFCYSVCMYSHFKQDVCLLWLSLWNQHVVVLQPLLFRKLLSLIFYTGIYTIFDILNCYHIT